MKKTMMILTLVFASSHAMAADMTNTLSFTTTNGSLSQFPGQSKICKIVAEQTLITSQGPKMAVSHQITKQTQWTHEIPNATILESLTNEASQISMQSTETRMMIGGSTQLYSATLANGTTISILQQNSFQTVRFNPSTAAKEIVALIDLNCK